MRVKGYSSSVIGSREQNQDSFLVNDEKHLYAVADGVGGGLKGDVASKMAVEGLERYTDSGDVDLKQVMSRLQNNILKESVDTLGDALMGTTCTIARLSNYLATLCHVGDSRCYLFREPVLRQLTEDQEFYDETMQSTVLASYLGIPSDLHPLRIDCEQVPLQAGDRLLLCSDGLYRQMDEPRIVEILRDLRQLPEGLIKTLCEEAAQKDYSDNVTLVYVEIE